MGQPQHDRPTRSIGVDTHIVLVPARHRRRCRPRSRHPFSGHDTSETSSAT